MLRAFFMLLSTSKAINWLFVNFVLTRRFARRFIAGETLEQAIEVVKELNRSKRAASLNYLGEQVEDLAGAQRVTAFYNDLLQRIRDEDLDADITVKPSHLGLGLGKEIFRENLKTLQDTAARLDLVVEVDMEDSSLTTVTLEVFHELVDRKNNLLIALQTYLYRTREDLAALVDKGSRARLVKGAYKEDQQVAWPLKKDVDASYAQLIEDSLAEKAREKGFYPAFGTHDADLIEKALALAKDPAGFEFQMLLGIRRDWQKKLVDQGARLRIYVPFGRQWYPYFMRRLAERPANVLFMLRAMFSR